MSRKAFKGSSGLDDQDKRRDLSPSSQSQASGAALEWDPSADVGSSQVPTNTPIHQPRKSISAEDLSILDQIVLALNQGYDLNPYVKESRSRRFGGCSESRQTKSNSEGSDSSYKTATETDPDPGDISLTSKYGTSASSDWQTSGLTRSEIEYRSKKQDSSSFRDPSSVLWVEVNAEGDSTTHSGAFSTENPESSLSTGKRNIGIQTSVKKSESNGERYSSSTELSVHKKKGQVLTCQTSSVATKLKHQSYNRRAHHDHRITCCNERLNPPPVVIDHCQHNYVPLPCHCHSASVQGVGSGRSLGSNPKVNSEGSSNGSRSNGSELTPTCAALEMMIRENNPTLQNYGYEALEQHRSSLVRKMRKEFQHLERLNSLLLERRKGRSTASSRSVAGIDNSLEPSSSSDSKNEDKAKGMKPPSSSSHRPKSSSSADSKTDNLQVIKKVVKPLPAKPGTKPLSVSQQTTGRNVPVIKPKPLSYFLPYEPSSDYIKHPSFPASGSGSNNGLAEPNSNSRNGRPAPRAPTNGEDWFQSTKENRSPEDVSSNLDTQYTESYEVIKNDQFIQISLQEAFQQCCPIVVASLEERKNIVTSLKMEREARAIVKRDYFKQRENCLSPNESLNQALPAREPRLMSTKEMKVLTEKKIKELPEVKEKEVQRRMESDKKTNRLLSQVFSRKLRQRVLKGEVNILHSKTLIRH